MRLTETTLRQLIRSAISELWQPPEALKGGGGKNGSATLGMLDTIRTSHTAGWGEDTGWGDGAFYGEADDEGAEVDEIEDDQDPRPEVFDLVKGYRPEEIEQMRQFNDDEVDVSLPSSNHHAPQSRHHRYRA